MSNFEVYKGKDGFRWRLRARNGEIVASGEPYATKQNAIEGCEAVVRAAKEADIFYLKPKEVTVVKKKSSDSRNQD